MRVNTYTLTGRNGTGVTGLTTRSKTIVLLVVVGPPAREDGHEEAPAVRTRITINTQLKANAWLCLKMCIMIYRVCSGCTNPRTLVRMLGDFTTIRCLFRPRDTNCRNSLLLSEKVAAITKVELYTDCIICGKEFEVGGISLPMTWFRLVKTNTEIEVDVTTGVATVASSTPGTREQERHSEHQDAHEHQQDRGHVQEVGDRLLDVQAHDDINNLGS